MESIFFMIARWLEINDPNSNFIKQFKQLGYNLKMKRDQNEGQNELDDKEKQAAQPFEYFVNLLENNKYEDMKTTEKH